MVMRGSCEKGVHVRELKSSKMVQFYINGVIISSICLPDRHSVLTPWQLHSLTTDLGGLVALLTRLEIERL